ncbi:MAG: phage tail protein [Elainellaceae cyanobacterium]
MAGFSELLTASKFYLELRLDGSNDNVDATFLECQGFKRSQEAIEIAEATSRNWGKAKYGQVLRTKLPGNSKVENIILRRGMTSSTTLWKWFADVESGKWANQVRDGSLVIYDQSGTEQVRFNFQGAWPVRYSASDVNAQSSDIEIEELEISIDSLVRVDVSLQTLGPSTPSIPSISP